MGKLLRILTVFFLLLSIAALVLGGMLFSKREMLKGRTQKLENAVISIAAFLENEVAEPQNNSFAAKDTSDCTAEALDNPERSEFWKKYALNLEKPNLPTMDINQRRAELASYYARDPLTQKILRDEMGYRVVKGKGTMQTVLDDIQAKAEEQLKRLNETRGQLKTVREELAATIEELNTRKVSLRQALAEIVQLKATVVEKDEKIAALNKQVEELQQQKRALEDEIAGNKQKIAKLEDDNKDLQSQVKDLKKRLAAVQVGEGDPGALEAALVKLEPGVKGRVVAVNTEWNYAVVAFEPSFVSTLPAAFRPVDLMVKRGDNGAFVTKVKVTQVKRDKNLGIVDILTDWQQQPVNEGDTVFY